MSLSAASTCPEVQAELATIVGKFLAESGFRPARVGRFAGALRYRAYSWPLRLMMRLISGSQGRPTDTGRDHELTDWDQVDRFARGLATLLYDAERRGSVLASLAGEERRLAEHWEATAHGRGDVERGLALLSPNLRIAEVAA